MVIKFSFSNTGYLIWVWNQLNQLRLGCNSVSKVPTSIQCYPTPYQVLIPNGGVRYFNEHILVVVISKSTQSISPNPQLSRPGTRIDSIFTDIFLIFYPQWWLGSNSINHQPVRSRIGKVPTVLRSTHLLMLFPTHFPQWGVGRLSVAGWQAESIRETSVNAPGDAFT